MALAPATPAWTHPAATRGTGSNLNLLLVACYVLAFASFQNFAGLGAPDRAVPETLRFDAIAAIKAASRMIAAGLVILGLIRLRLGSESSRGQRLLRPLLLFGAWGILTTLWSPLPAYTFGHAMEFVLLTLVAILAARACDRPERHRSVLRHACLIQVCYLLTLLALSLADPARASLLRPRLETESPLFTSEAEVTSIKSPAEVACIAALGIILLVALRLTQPTRRVRFFFLPGLLVCGGMLFITQTRALIATALLLTLLTFFIRSGRRLIAGALLFAVVLCLAYMVADPYLDRVAATGDRIGAYMRRGQSEHELRGLAGRMGNWNGVIDGLATHPGAIFTGFGYSMATPSGKMWHEGALRRYTGHNILLDVLAGTGLFGLIPFLAGFALLTLHAIRGLARRGPEIHFFALLMILFAFLSGVFGDSIVGPLDPTSVAVFLIIGASLGAGAARAREGRA